MKRILFLGYEKNQILDFLNNKEDILLLSGSSKKSIEEINNYKPDIIISYGYGHIIPPDIVRAYKNKIINLHISFLPWNRGVSPNLWSFVEDTPKGVTIHYINDGIDTGDIILQEKVDLKFENTLESSYNKLKETIELLFIENCDSILSRTITAIPQDLNIGSYHTKRQTEKFLKHYKIENWKISVEELMEKISDKNLIDKIEEIRTANNKHWMDIVRLSFELDPVRSRDIFKKIKQCDHDINDLLNKLAENE